MGGGPRRAAARGGRAAAARARRARRAARAAGYARADAGRGRRAGAVRGRSAALAQAPPLVLLTACGSGAGPPRPGDDVAGRLAGAFLARGALVVLEALGDVEVEPTVRLSELLLAELRRPGATPADALRRARRALVDEGRFTAPADHGRLRLVGLGHAPSPLPADMPQAAEWRTAALLAGAVAVLATVLLVLGRRRTTATRGG
ncbi:MAG: CHAT domain-containing protein [Planctomycetota bacterium]